jgi:hypothetical protein
LDNCLIMPLNPIFNQRDLKYPDYNIRLFFSHTMDRLPF